MNDYIIKIQYKYFKNKFSDHETISFDIDRLLII